MQKVQVHQHLFNDVPVLLLGINIPVTSLHRIENNQRTVRDYEISALSVVLDIDVSELLGPITRKFQAS